jgi:hypothetical protein
MTNAASGPVIAGNFHTCFDRFIIFIFKRYAEAVSGLIDAGAAL